MIRPLEAADREGILDLAKTTGLFEAKSDMDQFREGLEGVLDGSAGPDHFWIVDANGLNLTGAAYYAPDGAHYPSEHAGEGVWNLYFIGVRPENQRMGVGSKLLNAVEAALRQKPATALIVETSGKDNFDKIRAFYEGFGYRAVGSATDFYGAGDDKITYRKNFKIADK
jgi:ribosomal protein S18 acetylase RimI-like enzyme